MADNYKDTIYRMIDSSNILYSNKQWFNANYLGGYVLECYCKLILSYALETGQNLSKSNVRNYSHRVSGMKSDIDLLMLSGAQISKYCIDINSKCANILTKWDPKYRYESNTHIMGNKDMAEKIKQEIETLAELIIEMDVDGVI